MKLTLDQLKVDSYASQVSENELTEVKGGTSPVCIVIGAAVLLAGCSGNSNDCHTTVQTNTTVDDDGCITTTVIETTTCN